MKKMYFIIAVVLILSGTVSGAVLPERIMRLGKGDAYPVPLEILRDRRGNLNLGAVKKSDQFTLSDRDSLGFTNDVIWVRFTVSLPEHNRTEWFLDIEYPLLNCIDIYIPGAKGEYVTRRYGDHLPFHMRDIKNHTFLIRLSADPGERTYYVRFQSESSMNLQMHVYSLSRVISDINIQKTIFGLFYGILLIMVVYNLLLAVYMRDVIYLSFAGFIFSVILVSLSLNGYGFQYIWPNSPWMNDMVPFILFLTISVFSLFSIIYMNFREINRVLLWVFYGFISLVAAAGIVSFFFPYHYTIMVGAGAYIPGVAIICIILIDMIRRKKRQAYFYAVAFSALLVGVVFTVLNRFGALPNNIIFLWGFQIGTVFCVALFSLGLADRVNTLKNSLQDINVHLEEMVEERTKQLSDAKDELQSANEELEAINERLTHTNREMEDSQNVYRKDMNMAANLQASLLAKRPPVSPVYDVALTFIPKAGVSGDFYDFYLDGETLVGMGIFDVSGHGIAPGLLTLMAKSTIAATFIEMMDTNLGAVVEKINAKLISQIRDVDNYLTGILLRFKGDRIEYINSAHPDILYRKADINRAGKVLDKSGKRLCGPFLGIDPSISAEKYCFQEITFKLAPGDCLLLYTDSLSESIGEHGEPYGEARITHSLEKAPTRTAQEALNHIISDFFSFISSTELNDDLTVILLKRR
jgi:serine phosphatase RsbU (regulator of sigma subunit)